MAIGRGSHYAAGRAKMNKFSKLSFMALSLNSASVFAKPNTEVSFLGYQHMKKNGRWSRETGVLILLNEARTVNQLRSISGHVCRLMIYTVSKHNGLMTVWIV